MGAAIAAAAILAGCAGAAAQTSLPARTWLGTARTASRPGSLDGTFGSGGIATVSSGMEPIAAAVDASGNVVVAGNVGPAPGEVQAVRLLPDGTLDSAFGSGGIVSLSMWDVASLTLLPGGKILLGGIAAAGSDAELVQLRTDGTPDPSFGNAGAVRFDYVANSSNSVLAVAPQADGSLIAGGFGLATSNDDYLTSLARVSAKGVLDTSFGTNGVVAMKLVGGVTALGLQADGKILVCGGFISPRKRLIVRFLENGTLDKNDAGGTLVTVAHTGSLTFGGTNAFALDGKLLQWTSLRTDKGAYVRVVRRLRDYSNDPSFRAVRFAFGSPLVDRPEDVEIAGDGKLLVGGQGAHAGNADFGLARLSAGGPLDDAFGRRGRVVTALPGQADLTALAIQGDGKIVAAGVVTAGGSQTTLAVARYLGG